jgi:iron complex outermembrane receptor protein
VTSVTGDLSFLVHQKCNQNVTITNGEHMKLKYLLTTAMMLFSVGTAHAEEAYADATEIIVTATKRETNLQDTPISIAVMSSETLQNRQVQSLIDLADGGIPSLRVATFESRQSALTVGMRGIVPGDANQPAREQGVGVYIDGVYLGRQHGLNAGFLDVERIEVLRGPQGTLFGRNTEGGAVNIISKAPTGEWGGSTTTGFGNYGSYNSNLRLNLPKFAGFSIKLDGAIQHQNATTKNPLEGQYGWNYYHRYGGRAAIRWEPTTNLTADVAVDLGRDNNTPFLSQLINYNPYNRPVATLAQIAAAGNKIPSGFIAPLPSMVQVQSERADVAAVGVIQEPSVGKTFGVMSTIKYGITDDLELRSITAWRTVSDRQFDNSGGANRTPVFTPNATFSRYSIAKLDQRQFSQELQAVGTLGNLDYVFGAYYFNESASDEAKTPNTNKWNATGTGYTIVDPATYPLATVARASIAYAKSYAFYGQGTYNLNDLHVTAGGRFTQDKKDGTLFKVNGVSTNFTFVQNNKRFDPIVTLAYDLSRDINVYAKYTTGYRAGGASSRSLNYRSFGPEEVKSYEIGSKLELFNRAVRFNTALYHMDRTNSQVDFNFFIPQPNGTVRNTLETVNAEGTTKIRGIEADLTVQPIEGLSSTLSYAYTDVNMPQARNTVQEQLNASLNPNNTTPIYQDVFVVYTPTHALSGSIDYQTVVGNSDTIAKFHIDANYASSAYAFDNENVKSEASVIVNGRVTLEGIKIANQPLSIAVWSRNLLNTSFIFRRSNANGAVLGDYANFNEPRTFGLEITTKF